MKKSMPSFIILAVFTLSLTIVPGARATLVGITGTGTPNDALTIATTQWIGKQFTTGGGGANWNLESVLLTARKYGTGSELFNVSLYTDSGTSKPGSVIATLSGATPGANSFVNYTYTAPANTLLLQNTSYWIVMSSPSVNTYEVQSTQSGAGNNTYTGLPGWSYANGIAWSDTGSAWTIYAGDRNPQLQVNLVGGGGGAVATPEPGTMMLLGSGVLTFGLSRFRRRKPEVIA